ncbi:MAG: M1 family metallopeptidase [Saprospiraceae bacterium]|nr:M1 family metallopeptidase [Saprospiraceae bacterium]
MRFVLHLLLLSFSTLIAAQKPYFQQEINYKINVKLEDSLHLLVGMMEMEYVNNSPDELSFIYIHLWANAYSSKTTAFAKQQLSQNQTKFHYASAAEMGGFSNLDFVANGKPLAWSLDSEHVDIAKLELPEPLRSGERIKISTPFTLKIPASFSRLGHVGTSYQITQWYPKPAVYDHKGWHPMPYLDMGEFYSEFGSFDVSIILPENYVVGATGTLQTQSEHAFLEARIAQTNAYHAGDTSLFTKDNTFPESSKRLKTLRYTAEKVHDFAWFADKRFRVQKGEVQLADNQKVDTWVMYTHQEENLWRKAISYVNRSVEFFSEKIGPYPYPHATAVQSALSAGGGMEYPMITVIDLAYSAKYLDVVLTHEVGHNWFYGILASNERQHPWMDEGINSYYENQYTNLYYANGDMLTDFLPNFLIGNSQLTMEEFSYLTLARQNLDLPPNTPSAEMNYANYGAMAYLKPIIAFRHLEQYLGMNTFDRIMQSYLKHGNLNILIQKI